MLEDDEFKGLLEWFEKQLVLQEDLKTILSMIKVKEMKFEEMIKQTMQGKVCKRKSKEYLTKITKFGTPKFELNRLNYLDFEFDDYLADDWEVYEEPKKTLSDKIDSTIKDINGEPVLFVEDVKESIKELIDRVGCETEILEIFGEELCK